jgi:1-aminocyclopropane-1-carboxylate deaminase/D-cysteine desulfhydrase-like pyridoxal-dependent ACC family enzyme
MVFVPEGGASSLGVRGAATILDHLDQTKYNEIVCAVGTGTMLAGLLQQSFAMIRGVSALKIPKTAGNSIESFLHTLTGNRHFMIDYRFHFGGYAKHPPELISFMNEFYQLTGIPTDLVYTSKLFFCLLQLIQEGAIKPGSKICAIHSGGLQGNRSLKFGTLVY